MREIKFRAWDKKENVMRTLVTVGCSGRDVWNPLYINGGFINGFEHSNYEVMQFTGLHDKNGKEIYEGDIVRLYLNFCSPDETVHIAKVVFENGCFSLEYTGETLTIDVICYESYTNGYHPVACSVIGNIYENPELLEAKTHESSKIQSQ